MWKFVLFLSFFPFVANAQAPECPLFKNQKECLRSVSENYKSLLDYIQEEYAESDEPEMIQAANEIKHYEMLACQRTCFN